MEEIEVQCASCRKTKKIPRRLYDRSKNKKFYCDRKCQGKAKRTENSGINNPRWSKVEVYCSYCGYPKMVSKYQKEQTGMFFCDIHCQSTWRSENSTGVRSGKWVDKVAVKCATCGELKYVTPYVASKHQRFFCNRQCQGVYKSENQTGSKCGAWKGGLSYEPYSQDFNEFLRRKIRERDDHVCQLCGSKQNGIALAVHHIDYNKKNSDDKNLISLCPSVCHSKTNTNRTYWTAFFQKIMNEKYKGTSSFSSMMHSTTL